MPICRYLSPLSLVDKGGSDEEEECQLYKCPSDLSLIESRDSGFINVRSKTKIFETRKPPNIEHELNVAKSLLQKGSTLTGDNLFDHLAGIIKIVINERPTNLIDYFEEFSHNLREQKFRIPERFAWTHYTPISAEKAYNFFRSMQINLKIEDDYDVCKEINLKQSSAKTNLTQFDNQRYERKLLLNENVLRLHFDWALCGFGFLTDEVLQLACALQKIQFQPAVEHARFWGKIYGLKKMYYIVEIRLTESEVQKRLEQMKEEMKEKICVFEAYSRQSFNNNISEDELTPGVTWQNESCTDLLRMVPQAACIPGTKDICQFDIPPEPIGSGLNRLTYCVVNDLSEEWTELPIVTPKQIEVSRKIKMYLTGDLEADIKSYPSFPGTEKHYLRAMIARITAGTYVAPKGYFRRLTKSELTGQSSDEIEEEELDIEDEYEEPLSNDALITENCSYIPNPRRLMKVKNWVHVRPNILDQGRVVYFDAEEALAAFEREAAMQLQGENEIEVEVDIDVEVEDESIGENEEFEDDDKPGPEIGPALFTPCSKDESDDCSQLWVAKKSSVHNTINRLIMLRSNLWPGAFSFTIENYSDSIYLGWGCKYVERNITIPHMPAIQNAYCSEDYAEVQDPTVEMEEIFRMYMKMKELKLQPPNGEEAEEETDSCEVTP